MEMIELLRRSALQIETDGTPSQVGPSPTFLRDVANELERMYRVQNDLCDHLRGISRQCAEMAATNAN